MRTAESVSPMHPDKMCDRISDAILDAYLFNDCNARVAVEVMGGHGEVYVTGEITSKANIHDLYIEELVHSITGGKEAVHVNTVEQSPDIAKGVDTGGAGDQGVMIGYACNDTPVFLPLEVEVARSLNRFLYSIDKADGKTQVTINHQNEIQTIVASWCGTDKERLTKMVEDWVWRMNDLKALRFADDMTLMINPAGDWNVGGFDSDTGLTGRKLAIDNYGNRVPIGGGAFSGKDPSKVDRSAAYMARKIAVDLLKETMQESDSVLVRLAYAIGHDQPVEATAEMQRRGSTYAFIDVTDIGDDKFQYDLSPNGIIKALDLKKTKYQSLKKKPFQNTARFTTSDLVA